VRIKLMVGASTLALAVMAGCGSDASNSNTNTTTTNSNVKAEVVTPATEYETTTATTNGVTTETRTYRNNPRLSKVVITTRDGKRTAVAVSGSGEEAELHTDDLDDYLRKSGDEIAKGAGFVADKAQTVGEKAVEGAKTVGEKTGEGAKKVGEKTVEGAKTVGNKTVEGAKKVGGAVKNAVTP
jgi:hypothetical protein